jgi:hypothetical protein
MVLKVSLSYKGGAGVEGQSYVSAAHTDRRRELSPTHLLNVDEESSGTKGDRRFERKLTVVGVHPDS